MERSNRSVVNSEEGIIAANMKFMSNPFPYVNNVE